MGFWVFILCMVMLIPLLMLVFGLLFRRTAPREINYLFGYRTTRSMKNRQTWEFSHRLFGNLWSVFGACTLIASVIPLFFVLSSPKDVIGSTAIVTIFIQLAIMILPIPIVETALRREFDKEGNRKT